MSSSSVLPLAAGNGKAETIIGEALPFAPAGAVIGASVFESFDSRAFDRQFSNLRRPENSVRFLLHHQGTLLIGTTASGTLSLTRDDQALRFAVSVPPSLAFFPELVARGDIAQVSVGFRALDQLWGVGKDGMPTRFIREAWLTEISAVATGTAAYAQTWAATRQQTRQPGARGLTREEVHERIVQVDRREMRRRYIELVAGHRRYPPGL